MSLTRAKRKRDKDGDVLSKDQESADQPESSDDEDAIKSTQQVAKRAKRAASHNLQQHGFMSGTFVGEIYRSNMFKLQVDALLEQLKPNIRTVESTLNSILRDLKSLIEAIPEQDPLLVCSAAVSLLIRY